MTEFMVELQPDGRGGFVIAPHGEIDLATHVQVADAVAELVDGGQVDIVLDLDDTSFIDSTALGTFVVSHRRALAAGGSFTIICNDERLLRIFSITSLDRVFTIRPS